MVTQEDRYLRGKIGNNWVYLLVCTFVDDLFSLIIDMPTLHRLACFRDDVVFIIFCIQWWIYGAKKRKNDDNDTSTKKKKTE